MIENICILICVVCATLFPGLAILALCECF